MKHINLISFDLQMFAAGDDIMRTTDAYNATTQTYNTAGNNDLSPTMKEFYDTELLENARADLYFTQFGKKQVLPKNHGNTVEWRKWNTFAKALTPLTEGVTPSASKLGMTKITKQIAQYGDYAIISDRLELEAVDNVILGCTEELGAAMGETLDTITRNALMEGTNVMYGGSNVNAVGSLTASDKLTPTLVNKAATFLKKMKAPKIDGSYIAIIHPSVAEDLRESDAWKDVHKYASVKEIFKGEIGELHGVRFVETTEAPVSAAGASNACVYSCFFLGKDAYGVIDPTAESAHMICKQRGSSGTSDPLDQRSTVGYKASHAAKILYEERIVRVEVGSSYSSIDQANYTRA